MQVITAPAAFSVTPSYAGSIVSGGKEMAPPSAPVSNVAGVGRHMIIGIATQVGLLTGSTLAMLKAQQGQDGGDPSRIQPLEKLAGQLHVALASASRPRDKLVAAGPEMALMSLSMEMTQIIDDMLKLRTEGQKARNEQIRNLNDLMNALRKLEKSKKDFSLASLDAAFKKFPADSPIMQRGIEMALQKKEEEIAKAGEDEKRVCDEVVKYNLEKNFMGMVLNSYFTKVYSYFKPEWITTSENGQLVFWKYVGTDSVYQNVDVHDRGFYPSAQTTKVKNAFLRKQDATNASEKKYSDYMASGECTISDALYGLGIYADGEDLPQTKEDLEAAHEKISSMANSIDTIQTMNMTDMDKFAKGRNEAYDAAVKVNNRLIDSLNALIKQLGER